MRGTGSRGLPAYSADGDGVENEDLVVWYTMGFHHVPRVEDWPIMPVLWHSFTLRPFNFFDENPAYGVPANFAQPEPPALRSTIDSAPNPPVPGSVKCLLGRIPSNCAVNEVYI